MNKKNNENALEGFVRIKSISDPAFGTVDVLSNDTSGEQVIMKIYVDCEAQGRLDYVIERVRALQGYFISPVRCINLKEGNPMTCLVYFDIESKNLYKSIRDGPKPMEGKELFFLFESLAKTGCFLEENLEHHPSITQQNIYRRRDGYFIMHPYIYDHHFKEAVFKRRLFEFINKPFDSTESISQKKRERIKQLIETDSEARCYIQSNQSRLLTNMFQIGVVVIATGLGQRDQDVKESISAGKLDLLLTVVYFQ